jgi:hypothetical protein
VIRLHCLHQPSNLGGLAAASFVILVCIHAQQLIRPSFTLHVHLLIHQARF